MREEWSGVEWIGLVHRVLCKSEFHVVDDDEWMDERIILAISNLIAQRERERGGGGRGMK